MLLPVRQHISKSTEPSKVSPNALLISTTSEFQFIDRSDQDRQAREIAPAPDVHIYEDDANSVLLKKFFLGAYETTVEPFVLILQCECRLESDRNCRQMGSIEIFITS